MQGFLWKNKYCRGGYAFAGRLLPRARLSLLLPVHISLLFFLTMHERVIIVGKNCDEKAAG
jgi:hypothetical protein